VLAFIAGASVIWVSLDAAPWEKAADSPWQPRSESVAVPMDARLFVMTGLFHRRGPLEQRRSSGGAQSKANIDRFGLKTYFLRPKLLDQRATLVFGWVVAKLKF
jgi:hypothetical protein